jgi:hypothetical protein
MVDQYGVHTRATGPACNYLKPEEDDHNRVQIWFFPFYKMIF